MASKVLAQIMQLKPTEHKKAAELYKEYAKFFSGKTHKELRETYRFHLRQSLKKSTKKK